MDLFVSWCTEHHSACFTSVVLPAVVLPEGIAGLKSCEIQLALSALNCWNPLDVQFLIIHHRLAESNTEVFHPRGQAVVFLMSFFSLSWLLNLWFDLPWPWGAYDRGLPPEHKGSEIFRPGSCWMDACSRLPWFKVNNTPAVTPSRDGIASMRLAAGKRRSDIQFVCVCMRLWCFCAMCEICNSLLKPVCCLKRAEFQLQLQISLKGRAFMFLWSERAAHYSLPVAFIAHKEKTHFPIRNQIGHTSILSFSCDVYEATDHWPRSDLSASLYFWSRRCLFLFDNLDERDKNWMGDGMKHICIILGRISSTTWTPWLRIILMGIFFFSELDF